MWELDHKESWVLKNWCFCTVELEKTLESPLDCEDIKPVNPKGNQSWIFTGGTDAEAEAPIIWPPDGKSQFIGKEVDNGKVWRQEEKGTAEDEMAGWHHWLNGRVWASSGSGDGQGSLVCCSPWGRKDLDKTELLNNNNSHSYMTAEKAIALTIWTFVGKVISLLFNTLFHKFVIALRLAGLIFLQSKWLSRVFSNTTVQNHLFFDIEPSLWSNSHIHTWLLEKP